MSHKDEREDRELIRSMVPKMTIKVDPSVKETDMYLKGEPAGSVPMNVTIGKPRAYFPPKKGPK